MRTACTSISRSTDRLKQSLICGVTQGSVLVQILFSYLRPAEHKQLVFYHLKYAAVLLHWFQSMVCFHKPVFMSIFDLCIKKYRIRANSEKKKKILKMDKSFNTCGRLKKLVYRQKVNASTSAMGREKQWWQRQMKTLFQVRVSVK